MSLIDQPKSHIPKALDGLHLFHFDGAPCAQRVRFALGEKGLARGREARFDDISSEASQAEPGHWVSRIVSLPKRTHMTQAYADIHPNMVVPALVHNGKLYLESMDIIQYLDEAFGGTPLIPQTPELREATMARVEEAKVLHLSLRYVTFRWGLGRLAMLNAKEHKQLAQLAKQGEDGENLVHFYDVYSNRKIPEATFYDHLNTLYRAFCDVDKMLSDGRQFLMSDQLSIADAFWAMKILRVLQCGYPVKQYHPNLHAWYLRIYQRPAFQNEVMSNNRFGDRFFRVKSTLENLLGIGLKQALTKVAK